MAATKSPRKPPFAICDGRLFSGRTCRLGWSYVGPPELHAGLCPAALPSKCNALQNQGDAEGLLPQHPLLHPQAGGWPVGRCCREFWEASLLSNPLLPKSLLVTRKWKVPRGGGGEPSVVAVEMGSPLTGLISAIWENTVSVFSFVTAIPVVKLDYRAERPDYAVKCLLLRDCVEGVRCRASPCSLHSSSGWFFTSC